jgi:putative MATE family efflux protein
MSFSSLYSSILRSVENVIFPVIVSTIAILTNLIFNYLLIFGTFGFPKLGVEGAAIATLISRIVEASVLIIVSYIKKYPTFAPIKKIFSFSKEKVKQYLKTTLPVIGQTMGWTLGASMYTVIYGHIGTESFAAYNLASSIEKICLIVFTSLGAACSIMLGNQIGANELDKTRKYSKSFIKITVVAAIILSVILISIRGFVTNFYNIDYQTKANLYNLLFVMAIILVARSVNIIFMMGILRSGGDTFFAMLVDVGGVWIIGLPFAAFAAFVLHLPVHLVMVFAATEEFVKMALCLNRYFNKKWLRILASDG